MGSYAQVLRRGYTFGLHATDLSVSRLGKITSPPDGNRLTFLTGSTEKIQWTFDDDISLSVKRGRFRRSWYFTSSDGSQRERTIATIYLDREPRIFNSTLPGIAIEKPATLVLKNIDLKNNGTYRFKLVVSSPQSKPAVTTSHEVVVFIAGKWSNHSSLILFFSKFFSNSCVSTFNKL